MVGGGWKSYPMSQRTPYESCGVQAAASVGHWASPCQCVAAGRVQTQTPPSLQWAVGGGTWSHRVTPTLVTPVTLTALCTSKLR